ncbi:ABC transporter substrate-binding protein [Pseudogulbenkiania sp. MAI-1]|uniref:substrate-binding periplasmic protein n=1 Tax=Pseudogulbenkiania sp. MAI-1 TaxID=990370 RepID=UPI0004A25F67|nr:transporter substrate-binding domain-containing protein [Pseudogulbenkiania sp. MAI-1]
MRRFLSLLWSLLALVAASSHAAGPFTVCFEEWQPYAWVNPAGQAYGPSIDIYRQALRQAGIPTVAFKEMQYNRCSEQVKQGLVDMKLFVLDNELPGQPQLHEPTEYWQIAAIVRQDSPLQHYQGLSDFERARLALITGYLYPEPLDAFIRTHAWSASDPTHAYRLIASKRVDAVFLDLLAFEQRNRTLRLPLRPLQPVVARLPVFAVLSSRHQELSKALDAVIGQMREQGEIDRLYRLYTGRTLAQWLHYAGPVEGTTPSKTP